MRARGLLVSGLLLAAAAAWADTAYVHPTLRFGFTPPAGWVQKQHPEAVVVFLEPLRTAAQPPPPRKRESDAEFLARVQRSLRTPPAQQSATQANITVIARQIGHLSLTEYARDTRAKAARSRTYRILSEKPGRLGNAPSLERLVRLTLPGQSQVQTREVLCVRGGYLFTVALTAPLASFRRYSAEFDRVLASFVWQD